VGKFLKTVTYQECTREASGELGGVAGRLCRIEKFEGHARACDARVDRYGSTGRLSPSVSTR
jgi:sulfopropanediol 3-dehydrogenase